MIYFNLSVVYPDYTGRKDSVSDDSMNLKEFMPLVTLFLLRILDPFHSSNHWRRILQGAARLTTTCTLTFLFFPRRHYCPSRVRLVRG